MSCATSAYCWYWVFPGSSLSPADALMMYHPNNWFSGDQHLESIWHSNLLDVTGYERRLIQLDNYKCAMYHWELQIFMGDRNNSSKDYLKLIVWIFFLISSSNFNVQKVLFRITDRQINCIENVHNVVLITMPVDTSAGTVIIKSLSEMETKCITFLVCLKLPETT